MWFKCIGFSYLHVLFEDVSSSRHIHNVVDDKFAEGGQQIPPLMKSLNLIGFILFITF